MSGVHLNMEGEEFHSLSRKLVRLLSISSMKRIGNPDSGSGKVLRYWIMLGCLISLRNSHSCLKCCRLSGGLEPSELSNWLHSTEG